MTLAIDQCLVRVGFEKLISSNFFQAVRTNAREGFAGALGFYTVGFGEISECIFPFMKLKILSRAFSDPIYLASFSVNKKRKKEVLESICVF